jgi:hypothetical protein
MSNVSDKFVDTFKRHFSSIAFSENHAIYEIMRNNMMETDRPKMRI